MVKIDFACDHVKEWLAYLWFFLSNEEVPNDLYAIQKT